MSNSGDKEDFDWYKAYKSARQYAEAHRAELQSSHVPDSNPSLQNWADEQLGGRQK